MTKRWQAKDIPDDLLISVIRIYNENGVYIGTPVLYEIFPMIPGKVLRAKLRILNDRRRVLEGCPCGCSSPWFVKSWLYNQSGETK